MGGIEAGVIFWEMGITRVAENTFNEIQISDERTRDKETCFHRPHWAETGYGWHDDGAEVERDEALGRFGRAGGKREAEQFGWRVERVSQQPTKDGRGHRFFIIRNRQAALRDVENSGSGAAIAAGIVQDALAHAHRG